MGGSFKRRTALTPPWAMGNVTLLCCAMNAFDCDSSGPVSMTQLAHLPGRRVKFRPVRPSAPAAEGVGWACRTKCWATLNEIGLLAPRLGTNLRLAGHIELLAALLASPVAPPYNVR